LIAASSFRAAATARLRTGLEVEESESDRFLERLSLSFEDRGKVLVLAPRTGLAIPFRRSTDAVSRKGMTPPSGLAPALSSLCQAR
jgi:hypothetical protein